MKLIYIKKIYISCFGIISTIRFFYFIRYFPAIVFRSMQIKFKEWFVSFKSILVTLFVRLACMKGLFRVTFTHKLIYLQQQSERYLSSAYEGGAELSPVAPATSPGSPRDCTSCRKREPPDAPQPPPDDACAGCGARITDRYYLLALERRWHTPCLRCCECKMPLDSEQRCYARDSNIFCKNDYFR